MLDKLRHTFAANAKCHLKAQPSFAELQKELMQASDTLRRSCKLHKRHVSMVMRILLIFPLASGLHDTA